jgi:hypothetical protein
MIKLKIPSVTLALALATIAVPARSEDALDPAKDPILRTASVAFGTINEKGFYARPGFSVEESGTGGLWVPILLTGLCGLIWLGGQKRADRAG